MSRSRKKKKVNKKFVIVIFILFVLLIICALKMDKIEDIRYNMMTVDINGTECRERQNVEVYLLMGVDIERESQEREGYADHGQCDALYLLCIDRKDKIYGIIPVNRNTIMDVDTIDEDGNVLGTSPIQVEFAHTSGDGAELSCQNVENALSRFFYGHRINGFMSFTVDSIEKMNHELGGVTVTVKDDLTADDPELREGAVVKLSDKQAVSFVRGRMQFTDNTTVNRIHRQIQYIESAKKVLIKKVKEDIEYAAEFADSLREYTTTDISDAQMLRIAQAMAEFEYVGSFEIEGTDSEDELGFAEFTADEASKAEAAMKLLYKAK